VKLVRRMRDRLEGDDGVILVLAALLIVVLFALAALAVDIALQTEDRQELWNTADAATLAGASQLPDDPEGAAAEAFRFALDNDPELAGELVATYRCIVGDRDNDGLPDLADIPAACDPGSDFGTTAPPWVCADGKCSAVCFPAEGDTCNTLVMELKSTVDYAFAPVIGKDTGETGVVSAACRGACGSPLTGPLDLILVIDRTTSMSDADLANAKAASRALLNFLDPTQQRVGLAAINSGDGCTGKLPESGGRWLLVGLSTNYKNAAGDLNTASSLVSTIDCLEKQTGTDLGSPISDEAYGQPDALSHLLAFRKPGVKQAIMLLSDGAANHPDSRANHCQYALDMANKAKAQGVEMFTIGFGIAGKACGDDTGDYTSAGNSVSHLLAAMANDSGDNCGAGENSDGDNFFCEPKSGDLSKVFLAAASQLVTGSKLVQLPPGA